MSTHRPEWIRNLLLRMGWGAAVAALVGLRGHWPPRSLEATGPVALRDLALTVLLWSLTLLLAAAAGGKAVRWIPLAGSTRLERALLAMALGMGVLGYAAFGLGLASMLTPGWISALLILLALWVGPEITRIVGALPSLADDLWRRLLSAPALAKATVALGGAIAALAFLHALSPPWDYDGLMYHLVGPQMFLDAGRIVPSSDNWYVNGPFTLEMVFSLGMAFGDDVFPKLIHFTMGLVFCGAAVAAGRRWLGKDGGWLSAAVLLGAPALPIWAAFAYIDLGWATFEFLALYAMLIWWERGDRSWLATSGLLIGLAMGSKYLGLQGFAILGLFVFAVSLRGGLRRAAAACATVGLPAVLVAAPWYIKNAVWFGNPVYPLYFGGPGWEPTRLGLYSRYLDIYGVGRGLLDYLLLPFNIYAHHARFGAVMNQIDIPAVLFPLAIGVLFIPGRSRALSFLAVIAVMRFALWSLGSQQIRFLLPIYPALAVLAAAVILQCRAAAAARRPWHLCLPALAVGMLTLTLFYQVIVQAKYRPLASILGVESRDGFLSRIVRDFPAVSFALDRLPAGSRMLLVGDGRSYYCGSLCLADPDHFRWAGEISALRDNSQLAGWFSERDVSHLLLSLEDLDFLLQHDPGMTMQRAIERLIEWRQSGCLTEVYADEWALVYQVSCR